LLFEKVVSFASVPK